MRNLPPASWLGSPNCDQVERSSEGAEAHRSTVPGSADVKHGRPTTTVVHGHNRSATMKSPVLVGVGAVLTLLGLLFMFQGLGAIKGSSMTNSDFWAVAGPVIAVVGVVLVVRNIRRSSSGTS
jgi:hypothetical protein